MHMEGTIREISKLYFVCLLLIISLQSVKWTGAIYYFHPLVTNLFLSYWCHRLKLAHQTLKSSGGWQTIALPPPQIEINIVVE